MTLSKEEILNYEEPSKQIQLPSGTIITIKYLAYFPVQKILEDISDEKNKEEVFSERVVELMLRENEQKELFFFPREDQIQLIRLAAKEWGCQEKLDKLIDYSEIEESFYESVVEKNNRFHDEMIKRLNQMTPSFYKLSILSNEWFESYQKNLSKTISQLTSPLTNQFSESFIEVNQKIFEQFSRLGQQITQITGIDELLKTVNTTSSIIYEQSLVSSIAETLSNFHSVMDNMVTFDQFSILPEIEKFYPLIEMRNLSIATNITLARDDVVVTNEVIISKDDKLNTWLRSLDPAFPDMLKGAKQATESTNVDRCRHFASSHRELCTHLLHRLAPDDEIKEWTNNPNHYHNGQPTRRARLLFIARNRNNKPFVNFFVSNFITKIDLLNVDQHRRQYEYDDNDLRILHKSFLSTLELLMQISRS